MLGLYITLWVRMVSISDAKLGFFRYTEKYVQGLLVSKIKLLPAQN